MSSRHFMICFVFVPFTFDCFGVVVYFVCFPFVQINHEKDMACFIDFDIFDTVISFTPDCMAGQRFCQSGVQLPQITTKVETFHAFLYFMCQNYPIFTHIHLVQIAKEGACPNAHPSSSGRA